MNHVLTYIALFLASEISNSSRPMEAAASAISAPVAATPLRSPGFWMPDTGSGWLDFPPDEGGHIVISITLNGRPAKAMIDTGVQDIVVGTVFAKAGNFTIIKDVHYGEGLGGRYDYEYASGVSMNIGTIRTTQPGAISIADLGGFREQGLDIDAIIGMTLLEPLGWEVDRDHHRIRFFKSGSTEIRNSVPIRFDQRDSRLLISMSINGRAINPTMIDTGSDESVSLTVAAAHDVDFRPSTDLAGIGMGGTATSPIGRLRSLVVGASHVANAYASVGNTSWYDSDGTKAMIGMGLLQRYNIIADVGAGKMGLAPRITTPPPMPKSTSGIQGPYHDGRLTIEHVMLNSPAEAIGLKVGDEICSLDGETLSPEVMSRHWGRAASGTHYKIGLCDGTFRDITLRAFY